VALGALDRDARVHGAAPADLDHIAQSLGIGRLADQAGINHFVIVPHPIEHLDGAVDRRTFLIAGDQHTDGAAEVAAAPFDETPGGRGEGGHRAFHVRRAAPVEPAVAPRRLERIGGPVRRISRRHHVRVAGEAEVRLARAEARIEVVDVRRAFGAERQAVAGEADLFERRAEHVEGACVGRRHARPADQGF